MKQSEFKIVFCLIAILLGTVIAVQFRTVLKVLNQQDSIPNKLATLKKQLAEEKNTAVSLKKTLESNTKTRDEYLKNGTSLNNYDSLKAEWEITKIKAGFTDVIGQGVVITVADSNTRSDSSAIVHDSDLVYLLNELKKAGAQAISINGERIISTSEQICAGPTILINKRRITKPFEIKAIGNVKDLSTLIEKSFIVLRLKEADIKVQITKSHDILIPKYNQSLLSN